MKTGVVKVSSSPGREKLPAPPGLACLLYSKAVGNRSRGRTTFVSARSSPIFASRSRSRGRSSSVATAAAVVAVEGEPSSPKVTCIGQVRIRSKRKPPANKERSKTSSPPTPCRCIPKVFPVRKKPPGGGGGGRRSLWRRWPCIRSSGNGRHNKERKADPVAPQPQPKLLMFATRVLDQEDEGKEKEEEAEEAAHVERSKASPPKNALLLMRCRSAPHNRSSSLTAARFTASPLPPPPDVPGAQPAEEVEQEQEKKRKPSGADGAEITQWREEEAEAVDEWDEAWWSESRRPLVLPRSKSEPAARAAAKLATGEAASCFWHRRPSPVLVELAHYCLTSARNRHVSRSHSCAISN